jgi:hypothetical protein
MTIFEFSEHVNITLPDGFGKVTHGCGKKFFFGRVPNVKFFPLNDYWYFNYPIILGDPCQGIWILLQNGTAVADSAGQGKAGLHDTGWCLYVDATNLFGNSKI